ncbi:peptidase S8/S53 domain-containing protein [Sordaria brevicollis]|uniref:Peptidase S8/S53 domain-containing protein n=1 Tax=Sordaria brevicollis TaxID=83679 RepID=A0AAE0UCY4_SORBR|nr:peptidase S8/S53 domain-containing protein [Sordaria brevicollis]
MSVEESSRAGRIKRRQYNQLEIVKRLIEARPGVLLSKDHKEKDTPFQLRLRGIQEFRRNSQQQHDVSIIDGDSHNTTKDTNVDDHDKAERNGEHQEEVKIINDDPVLRYIREYVIDRFDRRKAMEALYKVGCERVIEFDLSGLPYTSIDADFLHGLGKVLRFEGLLKYVALPRLTVSGDVSNINPKGGKGLRNMCAIFKWLKQLDVQTVLKVTVIDDEEPSHSDEAIETCMTGLNVRVWNWYKVDICTDVIFNSAPNVTEVTLYSSGSNAVLLGWSSSAGLVKLKKVSDHRNHTFLTVLSEQGLETATRLERYRKTFESELSKKIPDIRISWGVFREYLTDRVIFSESKWLKTMKTFATFLQSAQPSRPIPPVKIAIIDDGINTTLPIFSNRIQVGESFYRPGTGRRHGAYYVPTGPHGTLMAQLICEICPVVKLYIAQLEYVPTADEQHTHGRSLGRGGGAGRSFTTESAIEAINWAVSQGVDIISMSWSIGSTSGVDLAYPGSSNMHSMNSNVIHPLDQALSDAVLNQIVMFCSSTDQGPTAVDNTYPGRNPSVIKVGASTGQGAKLSWVSGSKSDFLLPGEATMHTPYGYGPNHGGTASGSSISTALAAGLAGVLIYCERLLNSEALDSSLPMKDGKGQTDGLRAAGKMKEAFEHMSKGTELSKFPQVWDYVPTHLDDADFRRGNPSAREVQPDGSIANPTSSSRILRWNKKAYPAETLATRMKLEEFLKKIWK